MFYAEKNSNDYFGALIMGDEFLCFHHTHLSGRMPFFLVEIPCKIDEDDAHYSMSKPMLISGLKELKTLCHVQEQTIEELKVSMIFHGFMIDEPEWQCQRVTEVLHGWWKQNKHKLETVRVGLSNGKNVYLTGMKPDESVNVAWERML